MKNRIAQHYKKALSLMLCTALILTSFCFFAPSLIVSTADAASYTKTHQKEYYYAPGTKFITYLGLGGNSDSNTAKYTVINSGYVLIDKDLNAGAGGNYVYLGYKMGTDVNNALRGLRISISDQGDVCLAPGNNITYTKVGIAPISDPNALAQGIVDLNKGKSSAHYLYYMGTKDASDGAPVIAIEINNEGSMSGYDTVKYINSDRFNSAADANEDAGGEYIFTHLKRLPEVNTADLRSAMSKADTYIASSSLYVDISGVVIALNNAKKITDAYDNYAGTKEAFSTVYNQAAINNAKGAIDDAIAKLQTKLDWTEFNKAVTAANALNANLYYDLSVVRNTVNNAQASKPGFTTQDEVDAATARINKAISELVKKPATTSSYNGATIYASGLFQSSVVLSLYNVTQGSSFGWVDNDTTEICVSNLVYQKTGQYNSSKWNASTAKIVVDCDETSDIFETGIRIGLNMPWVYSKENRARWGVQLYPYTDSRRDGNLSNAFNTTTVTSKNGQSLTYTLCDSAKNTMASAETCGGNFDLDAGINSNGSAYGEYSWYLKGAVPKAGDSAVVRVVGICASWAYSNNLQELSEWTDLTIVSVSKKALKEAVNTTIANESIYTADSYANYQSALNAAKAVINKTTESQAEIDTAANNLKTAIANLKTSLDMTALYAARDKANSLNSTDYVDFSRVAILVSKIPNTKFNSQAEVDEFTTELNVALSKLVRKNSPTGSQTAQYVGVQVWPSWARVDNSLKLMKADSAASSYFNRTGDSGDTVGFIGDAADSNGYRNVVRYYPSTAKATYNLDRYNYTNLSQLGNIIEATATTGGRWHQQSLSLYSADTVNSYDSQSVYVSGSKTGKVYNYTLTNGGFMLGASDGWYGTSGDFYNVRTSGISGAVPDAGDSITIRPMVRSAVLVYNDKTIIIYNGWADIVVNAYDTTALRNAISRSDSVLESSKYSASSYTAYANALNEATAVINNGVINQDTINAKTSALNSAIDNLERISTVTFDQQSADVAGTASVTAVYDKAMPSITLPTKAHYSFGGYYSMPNGQGTKYYNADGSSAMNYDSTTDITLYASWVIDSFTVRFIDNGEVLRSAKLDYGTMPEYSGDTPVKAFDSTYHYEFKGWTPAITTVLKDTDYTADFTAIKHNLECINDGDTHHFECECGYKTEPVTHTTGVDGTCPDCGLEMADYTEVNELISSVASPVYYTDDSYKAFADAKNAVKDNLAKSRQDEVDAMADAIQTAVDKLEIKVYPVSVPDGCSYSYSKNAATNHYKTATITAPIKNGAGEYFSYWTDENGKVVSTFLNYTFYSCTPRSFKPVYGKTLTADDYIASEVLGVRDNLDGTYSILVEHSASSKVSILGHGVLFTYDNGKVGNLVLGSTADGVFESVAAATASTRTGLFEVKITVPEGTNNIYLKPYVINISGDTVYGDNASFTVVGKSSAASVDSVSITEYAIDESAEESEITMPDYQLTIWEQIAAFFLGIWKFIMSIFVF